MTALPEKKYTLEEYFECDVEILLSEIYLDVEFPEPSQNLFLVDR